ncbi:MAG: hypothetical protein DHS20C14_20860 [Phycisphaeraceae bacterium]|nr:MAG: hypothetical protein DHS20C14_20860 [Phycisphaeraceae bacterium]
MARLMRRNVGFAAAVAGLLAVGGCSLFGSGRAEVLPSQSFRGPPMGLASTNKVHVVTMKAPHPGWRLEFDRAEEAAGPTRLLMSVRRPDPTLVYTRQIVDMSAATTVDADEPAEVYARIIEHDARRSGVPYERVLLGAGPE